MKKRILAFICVLALLAGVLPAGTVSVASAQTTTDATYEVGYASKNLNPWVPSTFEVSTDVGTAEFLADPENTADKKIYPNFFSQTGNQIDWDSVVTQLHDDNGDGNVDHGDGIFATCTAVTYGKGTADEKTVLFITTDTMKAWDALVNAVRSKITASDWGKALGIQADQIMVSSNHTHSGPALTGESGFADSYIDTSVFTTEDMQTALKTDRKNYYNWVVDRIVAAAQESVNDRAPATMSKGAVNATEATAALNYNSGNGYHMNAIRHYQRSITATKKLFGSIVLDSETIYSIYANTTVPSEQKLYDALSEHNFEKAELFNPEQFLTDTSYTTSWSTTDDADNTMYVLRFSFEDSTKEPVVFVNWRAHSTMNSGILSHSVLSGDYATGLRQTLADEGYRAAFFLGAAGNVVPHPTSNVYTVDGSLVKDKMDWLYEATYTNDSGALTVNSSEKTFVYGRMLAEIAQYCMEETDASGNSYMENTPVGEIATYKTSWTSKKNLYSQELMEAAIALRAEVMSAEGWDQATFESNYSVYFKNNSSTYFPYYYKPSGTTAAILNSRLHFNSVYSHAKVVIDNGKTVSENNSGLELNAIMLGEKVAFITSPNELADYYHDFTGDVVSHTTAEKEAHNDWFNLKDDAYGMPFVLGYANQTSGYIAGWLDHQANSETHATITGLGADGYMLYSPGTYESMTSSFAAGQGEALIEVYDRMLDVVSGALDEEAPCQYCSPDENVTWKPLLADQSNTAVGAGHYYLYEDLAGTGTGGQWAIGTAAAPQVTCIDLRGNEKFSQTRNFTVPSGSTLNIMDTVGGGKIRSQTFSNNPGGGNLSISSGGTVNLYGGTLSFTKLDNTNTGYYGVGVGGIVSLQGTLNMYGGTIEGADMVNSSYTSSSGAYFSNNGCGGAVYVYGSGKLNVYGGTITSGLVPDTVTIGTTADPKESVGKGPCVFLADTGSRVKVSGNAVVEDIFYNSVGANMLTVSGAYTGTAALTFDSDVTITDNLDIGNSTNAVLTGATITCTNNPLASVYVQGTNLLLSNVTENTTAMTYNSEGKWAYDSLNEAVSNYTDGYIQLTKDETAAATIDRNVYLDLAGHNVTGKVTVNDGYTLYAMDSNTNDYTIEDGNSYGQITNHSGNIAGVPVEATCAVDGYLMVNENGALSFHSVNLQLFAMTLRAVDTATGECAPSVYYKSYFKGDEIVSQKVQKYGVALSVQAVPDADNLESKCKYSTFDTSEEGVVFNSGSAGNQGNGTLLKGIMKQTNAALINNRNANMDVYGRAYILTEDGYMFGASVQRDLKEQTRLTDGIWNTLTAEQKESLVLMYNTYSAVMKTWNIPNISAAAQSA